MDRILHLKVQQRWCECSRCEVRILQCQGEVGHEMHAAGLPKCTKISWNCPTCVILSRYASITFHSKLTISESTFSLPEFTVSVYWTYKVSLRIIQFKQPREVILSLFLTRGTLTEWNKLKISWKYIVIPRNRNTMCSILNSSKTALEDTNCKREKWFNLLPMSQTPRTRHAENLTFVELYCG